MDLCALHNADIEIAMPACVRCLSCSLTALVLAACGSKNNPSGPSGPYSCIGAALPTTAPASITVTGTITGNVTSPSPLAGAAVTGFQTGNATKLDSATTNASGNFSLTIATGGSPVDGYVRVSKAGYIDTYGYPPAPLAASGSQSAVLITTSERNLIASAFGVTQTAGNGVMAVVVEDCNAMPVTGATLSVKQGGSEVGAVYASGSAGAFYVFNVPPGDVVVGASVGGNVLRAHTVLVRADVVTLTGVTPGPLN